MKVLFYSSIKNTSTDRLLGILYSVLPEDQVDITNNIPSFINTLLKYRFVKPKVLIQIGSMEDVSEVRGLRVVLDDLFLMVVAKGNDERLMENCRRLYPRFLTDSEDDYRVIADVIEKGHKSIF